LVFLVLSPSSSESSLSKHPVIRVKQSSSYYKNSREQLEVAQQLRVWIQDGQRNKIL